MEITRTGIAALVALCGAAGAGGAYIATSASPEPVTTRVQAAAPVEAPATDLAPTPAVTPVQPAAAAPARRNERASARPAPRPVPPSVSARSIDPVVSVTPTPAPSTAERASIPVAPVPVAQEPVADLPSAPQAPPFEELIVESDVVLGLQVDNTVSSETARVEDQVIAHITRDVRVGERVAIPNGAKVYGNVTEVERGGKMRERARLAVRFSSVLLSDGTRVPISTDLVIREGDSPTRESAAKIGGSAIGGAILGGIIGGGKGAILGGTAGAGAGTAIVMAGGRNEAVLAAGTPVTVRLTRPATIEVDR